MRILCRGHRGLMPRDGRSKIPGAKGTGGQGRGDEGKAPRRGLEPLTLRVVIRTNPVFELVCSYRLLHALCYPVINYLPYFLVQRFTCRALSRGPLRSMTAYKRR